MDLSDIRMDVDDIRTIENVFAQIDVDMKMSMDISELSNTSQRLHFINEHTLERFQQSYPTSNGTLEARLLQFNRFMWDIASILSFAQFVYVLQLSGYQNVCSILIAEREKSGQSLKQCHANSCTSVMTLNTIYQIPKTVGKRTLPHAEFLGRYYVTVKELVDNNAIPKGNRTALESGITILDKLLSTCRISGTRQLLVDKRVVLYFLLAQQYADCHERHTILKRMHDSMPNGYDVDRTTFDVVYHSYLAVDWARKGNDRTASEHMAIARQCSFTYLPCFLTVATAVGAHVMHCVAYLTLRSADHLQNASQDYEKTLALVRETEEEEQFFWRIATMLQRVKLLLGIESFLNADGTGPRPDEKNVKEARDILYIIRGFEQLLQNRQKTILYFSIGRLSELEGNIHSAVNYVKIALDENGLFDIAERRHIAEYLCRLQESLQ